MQTMHMHISGPAGIGKTLLARALARALADTGHSVELVDDLGGGEARDGVKVDVATIPAEEAARYPSLTLDRAAILINVSEVHPHL